MDLTEEPTVENEVVPGVWTVVCLSHHRQEDPFQATSSAKVLMKGWRVDSEVKSTNCFFFLGPEFNCGSQIIIGDLKSSGIQVYTQTEHCIHTKDF